MSATTPSPFVASSATCRRRDRSGLLRVDLDTPLDRLFQGRLGDERDLVPFNGFSCYVDQSVLLAIRLDFSVEQHSFRQYLEAR